MRVSRRVRILLYSAGGIIVFMAALAAILAIQFQPVARNYFLAALRERYQSDVEMGQLNIQLFPRVHATGDNVVFRFEGRRDVPPMVQIGRFELDSGFVAFFRTPKHINRVRLEGLRIQIPPRGERENREKAAATPRTRFVLDQVTANGTTLEIAPKVEGKEPLRFDIRELTLQTVGVGKPMTFHARLENPKPPGAIHSDGQFGPWDAAEPGDTPVGGRYTFRDADLSMFKGITGILSSDGKYVGHLNRIEVTGTTEIPDFALTIAGHAMPLHTEFRATVDGVNGNTTLHPVQARLGKSEFEVSGAIERTAPETRKTISLTAKTGGGARLEDFLRLAVKSARAPMTGTIGFDTKVEIPPGQNEVIQRMRLDGAFGLRGVRFTSQDVQEKIAGLSHRAQGDPKNHDPNITADFGGRFHLLNEELRLPDLRFTVPGAQATLRGTYELRGGALDFAGTARMEAPISKMTTGFKSKLLIPLDPLFRRDGAGAVVPIIIRGTRGAPSFKLDIGRVLRRD